MITVELPKEIEKRLDAVVGETKLSKEFFVREAVERFLEDLEDAHAADIAYEEFIASGDAAIPLEKVMKKYGMEA